jgi:hypothetical protein
MLKKKIRASFQRIIEIFTQKCVIKLSKIWVWDPGPGVKKAPDPGPTPDLTPFFNDFKDAKRLFFPIFL